MENLEEMRKTSLNFLTAQHIVALLQRLETDDIEATLKLVREIWQSKEQKDIALIMNRQEF